MAIWPGDSQTTRNTNWTSRHCPDSSGTVGHRHRRTVTSPWCCRTTRNGRAVRRVTPSHGRSRSCCCCPRWPGTRAGLRPSRLGSVRGGSWPFWPRPSDEKDCRCSLDWRKNAWLLPFDDGGRAWLSQLWHLSPSCDASRARECVAACRCCSATMMANSEEFRHTWALRKLSKKNWKKNWKNLKFFFKKIKKNQKNFWKNFWNFEKILFLFCIFLKIILVWKSMALLSEKWHLSHAVQNGSIENLPSSKYHFFFVLYRKLGTESFLLGAVSVWCRKNPT